MPADRTSTSQDIRFDPVEAAIAAIGRGEIVLAVDDENRENEGDLIMAAQFATPEKVGFIVRHTSGVICAPVETNIADRLDLPPMTAVNEDKKQTAYTVSTDAREGISTGISAGDRSVTLRLLADPGTAAKDLSRPGHVFPLRAAPGGVLRRAGHTEASVDLCKLAGLEPAAVIAELVHDNGEVMRAEACRRFADEHGLLLITIADLQKYRRERESLAKRVAVTRMPLEMGEFIAIGYYSEFDEVEHVALVMGPELDVNDPETVFDDRAPVLTRVHSECLTGDAFGSLRCDCGPQLQKALQRVAEAGRGAVVYLRGQEGRGIGLLAKLRAYALQDKGADTLEANLLLGLPADSRDYSTGAQILKDLGIHQIDLMTNNPDKYEGLQIPGLKVNSRIPLSLPVTTHNLRYLTTKRDRMGHLIQLP